MSEEYSADLITLIDEDENVHEFQILDAIETEDGKFVALTATDIPEDNEEGTYYIFEVITEDGEEQLAQVEDEELLDALAAIFEERFDELFEEDGE